jgi:hypothetical protein
MRPPPNLQCPLKPVSSCALGRDRHLVDNTQLPTLRKICGQKHGLNEHN